MIKMGHHLRSGASQFPALAILADQALVRFWYIGDFHIGRVEKEPPPSQSQRNSAQVEGVRNRFGQQEIPVGWLPAFAGSHPLRDGLAPGAILSPSPLGCFRQVL